MNVHDEGDPQRQQEPSGLRPPDAQPEALLDEPNGDVKTVLDTQRSGDGVPDSASAQPATGAVGDTRALLGVLLENMPDAVIVTDDNGRVVYANHSPLVADPDELVGQAALNYVAPEFHAVAIQSGLRMMETGKPQSYEMQDVRGGWWLCRSVFLPSSSGKGQTLTICTDISRRKEQEESLRKSETELRCLFDNTPDLVLMVDTDARIQFVNRPSPGASVRDMLGKPGFAFIAPEFQHQCHESLALAFASRAPQYLEMRDVFDHWWDCRLVPMTTEDGAAGEVMIICADVTMRKRTELSLRESERHYRLITENSLDFIWTARMPPFLSMQEASTCRRADIEATLDELEWQFLSPSVEQLLAYSTDEVRLKRLRDLVTPASFAVLCDAYLRISEADEEEQRRLSSFMTVELEHVTKTGSRLWCEIRARVVSIDDDGYLLLEGLTRDVSERKRFERDLATLRDRQRQEMAHQLHDELGQDLLGLRLLSESLRRTLSAAGHPAAESARDLAEAAAQTQNRVRQIIKGIRPVEVTPSGLMDALADLARSTRHLTDIACSFECRESVSLEDSHSATELFHIAQEAVRNAVRHANPDSIQIDLAADDGYLVLSVRDDGSGIPSDPEGLPGLGLRIMQYRASVIGAVLSVGGADPRGTLVVCRLPLKTEAKP